MNTRLTTRFVSLAAIASAAVLNVSIAAAAPKAGVPLMSDRAVAELSELPAAALNGSGVVGALNPAVLSAPAVEIALADGQKITARLQRVVRDDRRGTQSWVGSFDDEPGSMLVLTKSKGVVAGMGTYKEHVLEIRPIAGGKHTLFAIDDQRLPKADGVRDNDTGGGDLLSETSDYGVGETTLTTSGAVVHDVLIVYTAAAAGTWGQATLESMIQSAVQAGNQAYLNSAVNVTMNIVGLQQVAVTEGSGMQATLGALKQNATVRSLRDKLAADMVVLVSQDSDWCGYASLSVTSTNTDAYAVTYSKCLSNQTLAHEIGHLQGLDHDRANKANSGAYAYSFGYRMCTSGGFRDIMAYPCSGATRLNSFSSPKILYNGYPTGVSYESDPANSADNARTLNNTATKVAAYRGSSSSTIEPTTPAAPSALAASSVVYDKVSLSWTDNATNEAGYKVERSPDGVAFSEIASLGADAHSFADSTVSTSSRYYYRVRAFNSSGVSAYSNTVSVTTPATPTLSLPPATPTGVTSSNNADGTALVAWVADGTNVSSFEITRETWDKRKQAWGRLTTVATVPTSIRSLVDTTNNGTFRYFVRATGSGGSSGKAGPAQVTVSGGKGRK